MLTLFYRLLVIAGLSAIVFLAVVFGNFNQQLIAVHTPYGSDRVMLWILVLGCILGGMVFMFLIMQTLSILQAMQARRAERELRNQLKQKDKEIAGKNDRLAQYDAQTREFTLQVMQITHALGAPMNVSGGLALPQRHESPDQSPGE